MRGLGLYALFGGLLVASLRGVGPFVPTDPSRMRAVAWQAGLVFLIVLPLTTVLFLSERDRIRLFVLLVTWISGPILGLAILAVAVAGAVRLALGRTRGKTGV